METVWEWAYEWWRSRGFIGIGLWWWWKSSLLLVFSAIRFQKRSSLDTSIINLLDFLFLVGLKEDLSLYNIGTHSSCKLRMREEDSELSDDVAENTQVQFSVLNGLPCRVNYIWSAYHCWRELKLSWTGIWQGVCLLIHTAFHCFFPLFSFPSFHWQYCIPLRLHHQEWC